MALHLRYLVHTGIFVVTRIVSRFGVRLFGVSAVGLRLSGIALLLVWKSLAPLVLASGSILRRSGSNEVSRTSLTTLLKQHAATYNHLASSYHTARFGSQSGYYDLEELQTFTRELLSTSLGERSHDWLALDVACGTGRISIAVAQAGGRIVALDAALGMLRQCSTSAQTAGVQANVCLTNASAGSLPYKDATFDLVFSSRFLHLFPREAYPVLIREMARVVKPGGHIVVEMKNYWYGVAIYRIKDLLNAIRGENGFSSYISARQLRAL